ncbi:hypothetical protein [Bacillus ndiopicus]|nr:hypothetical protein [Bacillus ndiopicus]
MAEAKAEKEAKGKEAINITTFRNTHKIKSITFKKKEKLNCKDAKIHII